MTFYMLPWIPELETITTTNLDPCSDIRCIYPQYLLGPQDMVRF